MPCRHIDLGNGQFAIVCTRGERTKRCACGRPAEKLCDYQLRGSKAGKTCDKPLCAHCAYNVGPDKDYCGPHYRLAEQQGEFVFEGETDGP